MKLCKSILSSAALALALGTATDHAAFAMGHGPSLAIQHFNPQTTSVWLRITRTTQTNEQLSLLGQFEMGGGRQIQVLKSRPQNSSTPVIELPWPAGFTLAFVEGEAPTLGRLVAGSRNRGMYLITADEATRLQREATNFVWPVSLDDVTVVGDAVHERPNPPMPPGWQPRAVTKAEAVQPDLPRMMQMLETLTGDRSFMLEGKEVRITERGGTENRGFTQQYVMQVLSDL